MLPGPTMAAVQLVVACGHASLLERDGAAAPRPLEGRPRRRRPGRTATHGARAPDRITWPASQRDAEAPRPCAASQRTAVERVAEARRRGGPARRSSPLLVSDIVDVARLEVVGLRPARGRPRQPADEALSATVSVNPMSQSRDPAVDRARARERPPRWRREHVVARCSPRRAASRAEDEARPRPRPAAAAASRIETGRSLATDVHVVEQVAEVGLVDAQHAPARPREVSADLWPTTVRPVRRARCTMSAAGRRTPTAGRRCRSGRAAAGTAPGRLGGAPARDGGLDVVRPGRSWRPY